MTSLISLNPIRYFTVNFKFDLMLWKDFFSPEQDRICNAPTINFGKNSSTKKSSSKKKSQVKAQLKF